MSIDRIGINWFRFNVNILLLLTYCGSKKNVLPSMLKKTFSPSLQNKIHSYTHQKNLPPLFSSLDATKTGEAKKGDLEKFKQVLQLP